MFIVANDLSESQRERDSQVPFSPGKMNATAYSFKTVKTVFVELFCARKSSVENPSLRVNGHGGSMNRYFIVKNYA